MQIMNRFSKVGVITFLITALCSSCSDNDKVTININVDSDESSILYIARLDFKQAVMLDSVKISKGSNSKKIKVKQGAEPTFYTISTKKGGAITLLAEQNENISLNFDTKNSLNYTVNGSTGSTKVQTLATTFAKSKYQIDELSKKYLKSESEEEKKLLSKEFEKILNEQKEFNTNFIKENHMSKANIMAIYQKYNDNLYLFNSSDDLLILKTVASAWNAIYPESDYSKGMVEEIKRIEKTITNSKLQQLISDSEIAIPELEIPNKNGTMVKLSSLKGKVVLLDFWVSENSSSMLDNRELLGIYKQFKSKGFEVYQVALDANREEWINVLDSSELPWISVCKGNSDGSNAALLYNIQQIPANYLINRDQSIVGKNLYGDDLRKALTKLLN